METQTNIDDLVAYIEQHGVEAKQRGGRLYAKDDYMLGGIAFTRTVELTPTMAAVREWLGY